MMYRREIDGLRAVAILLVSIFHFRLFPMGEAGFIGVDVFFVISGFLITRLVVADLSHGTFRLGAFYVARLRRLMPALVTTLVLYLIVGAALFLPDSLAELALETLLSQLYVVNIYFWRTINYFGLRADGVPLLHMWSLAVEEQFYIFYPLALALIFPWGRRLLLLGLIGGCLGSFLLGWVATGWKPEASFYLLPTRAWELLAGGCLALLAPQSLSHRPLAALAGLTGAFIIALALILHTPVTPFPGWFAAFPVVGAILLILGGDASPTGRALRHPGMIWIGKISYPLYLVHWPIIILMRETLEEVTKIWSWAGFAGAIVLAWTIWRFVENPIRQRRILGSARSVVLASLAAAGLLGGAGFLGYVTEGAPNRLSPDARTAFAFSKDLPKPYLSCVSDPRRGTLIACPLGVSNQQETFAVLGDSHAQALAGATDLWLKDQGKAGRLHFYHGCMPLPGIGDRFCETFMRQAIDALRRDKAITTVVLVSAWRHNPGTYGGQHREDGAADQAFATALQTMIDMLKAAQKSVILVDPMYSAQNSVPETLARNIHFSQNRPMDRPLASHQDVFSWVHSQFEQAAKDPSVGRVSLIDALCAEGTCRAQRDGTPVFSDNNHIRFGQSRYFADVIASQLTRKD